MQLVINTPGTFITQKDECFRLKQKEKVFDISPLKVESLVITNQAMISTKAVAMALEHNIDVIFLDRYGDPLGRVWFSKMGSTALIRRRQLEAASMPLGVDLVTEMIVRKTENQLRFLKKLMHARPGKEPAFTAPLGTIEQALSDLPQADNNLEKARDPRIGKVYERIPLKQGLKQHDSPWVGHWNDGLTKRMVPGLPKDNDSVHLCREAESLL